MELVKGGLIVRTVLSPQGAGSDPGTLDVITAGELPPGGTTPSRYWRIMVRVRLLRLPSPLARSEL
jgi:hypothetical protein